MRFRYRSFMPVVRTWKPEEHGGLLSLLLLVLVICSIVLSLIGFRVEKPGQSCDRTVFQAIRLLFLEDDSLPVDSEQQPDNKAEAGDRNRLVRGEFWFRVARYVVLATVGLGFLGAGKLLFDTARTSLGLTFARYRNPVLICGLGEIGLQLTRDLCSQKKWVIVIEPNTENSRLPEAARLGALIVIGDACNQDILEVAQAKSVGEAFIVTGNDLANVEAASAIRQLRGLEGPPITCHVHLSESRLADALSDHLHKSGSPTVKIKTFHIYRQVAQQMVIRQLSRPGLRPEPGETSLYVMIGFGKRGQGLALQLAELAVLNGDKRSRLIVITHNAWQAAREFRAEWGTFCPETNETSPRTIHDVKFDREADSWDSKFLRPAKAYQIEDDRTLLPDLQRGIAIEYAMNAVFVEHPGYLADADFAGQLSRLLKEPGIRPVILCCEEGDAAAFTDAETLHYGMKQGLLTPVPVLVWISRYEGLRELVDRQLPPHFVSFGTCEHQASYTAVTSPLIEKLGREIKRDYDKMQREKAAAEAKAEGEIPGSECLPMSDAALDAAWNTDDEVFRHSNMAAAAHAQVKLALLGWQIVPPRSVVVKRPTKTMSAG